MMEFNFFREQGAITLDPETERFHVNLDKMPAAVEAMATELLMIEALGDYDKAKAFIEKYGTPSEDLERLLKKLKKIPVDIEPFYTAEEKYLDEAEKKYSHKFTHRRTHTHTHQH
jgi:hypothetical protein